MCGTELESASMSDHFLFKDIYAKAHKYQHVNNFRYAYVHRIAYIHLFLSSLIRSN